MEAQREQRELVEQARAGDTQAFGELARPCRESALHHAQAILGDFHLAEDAVQEAMAAAYLSLHTLRDPAGFAGWLHGIVRFQCYRLLRRRHTTLVSLDHALSIPARDPEPDEQLDFKERAEGIRRAVERLPAAQREVVDLFYFGDLSQREVASFLDMPLATVNNRLHAARQKLKGGLQTMAGEDISIKAKAGKRADDLGTVVSVQGSLFEARFERRQPHLMTTLEFQDAGGHGESLATVIQQPGDGTVRCLAVLERRRPAEGAMVRDAGSPLTIPVRPAAVKEAVRMLASKGGHNAARLVETGIKAIDLLCPLSEPGSAGLFAGVGAGKLVLLQELVHNLQEQPPELTLFDFTQAGHGTNAAQQFVGQQPNPTGALQAVYVPIDDPTDSASPTVQAVADELDAVVFLSHDMGREGLWPALDPLRSSSRLLETHTVSSEHRELAERVRKLVGWHRDLKQRTHPDDVEKLSEEDRRVWDRARRLENFLTQPFFSAEPYTKVPGRRVPLGETLQDCQDILEGRYDEVPEEAFLYVGAIAEAVSRA